MSRIAPSRPRPRRDRSPWASSPRRRRLAAAGMPGTGCAATPSRSSAPSWSLLFVVVAVLAPLAGAVHARRPRPHGHPAPATSPARRPSTGWGWTTSGRDELSRVIYGARAVARDRRRLAGPRRDASASLLGLLAGAFGGWVDSLVMRLIDIMLAVPGLLFAIGVAALLGQSA